MSSITFKEFESNGRFGLSVFRSGSDPCDGGSIGRGSAEQLMRFETAEGRNYGKQAIVAHDETRRAECELEELKRSIADLMTPSGRVRRKKVLELVHGVLSGR